MLCKRLFFVLALLAPTLVVSSASDALAAAPVVRRKKWSKAPKSDTKAPTAKPSTEAPSVKSEKKVGKKTGKKTSKKKSKSPKKGKVGKKETNAPVENSESPSAAPSTESPSEAPSEAPSGAPSTSPTRAPTEVPTVFDPFRPTPFPTVANTGVLSSTSSFVSSVSTTFRTTVGADDTNAADTLESDEIIEI
mmetsp:Transcript_32347/g.76096  ORF Transcript_32347/g.76096 Transcript_32347/m.76096 type:complete len:192 (-) Transcript_32347:480-1055(-)|eukprot:CAMPEP_0172396992 /NCGR_PEP_ID=MMETSP1061-20121228/28345_1 /TAXON_ID=37318 /ORGANISM="Pseudo-nitzschia pungens, Strain cf. pungens" /LENGTH=191 /DNA_ID=CAMNT_0013129015 /DNA_START=38 /DNA_END=613 /DNA_ORIENTATION=+